MLMKNTALLILCLLTTVRYSSAQLDTIISYEVRTGIIDTIVVPPNNSNATFDYTNHYTGLMPGVSPLQTTTPTQNLYTGSLFQRLERAALNHNLLNYPERANVKLFRYENDTLKHKCSGTLVDDNLVLTAGHCIFLQQSWAMDSILVAPSYDNGMFQPTLPTSGVLKYYIFKSSYSGSLSYDFALLELDDNIGKDLGWLSIAYNSDTAYFNNKVFHKFSYPIDAGLIDTSIHVNGDTMYYHYGEIDYLTTDHFGVQSSDAIGIPGQSGSSLFYTDNTSEYKCYGVLSFSAGYNHTWLNKDSFYGLKHIIDNHALGYETPGTLPSIELYPNPMGDISFLNISTDLYSSFDIHIYDVSGREIKKIPNSTANTQLNKSDFSPGIYMISILSEGRIIGSTKLVVN